MRNVYIHPSAVVDPGAQIGQGTKVWHFTHIQSGARIGSNCVVGQGVYVADGVRVGKGVKIQNNVSVFHGVRIDDGVFVGPHVCFTNDKYPRAVNHDGNPKGPGDWTIVPTIVRYGAALGAASTIVAGVTIGRWALVAAGALVASDVPDHGLVIGSPAKLAGYACVCARRLVEDGSGLTCPSCERRYARGKRVRLVR